MYKNITKPDKDVVIALKMLSKALKFKYHHDIKVYEDENFITGKKYHVQSVYHVIDFSDTYKCPVCGQFNAQLISNNRTELFTKHGFSRRKDGKIVILQNPYANKMILRLRDEINEIKS